MFFKYGIPAIAAGALAFAVLSVRHMKPQQVEAAPPLAPPSSEFERQIGGIGMVEAASENISIGTPVPGLVSAVYVRAGQAVRRGQPLMRLDDRDLGAELALRETAVRVAEARLQRLRNAPRPEDIPPAEARLEQARAQLADAEAQLRIIEAVPDRRAVRTEDLERRRWAVAAARAQLREAEAALAQLRAGAWREDILVAEAELAQARQHLERVRTDLERLTVTAPVSGRILRVNVRAGEFAGAPAAQPLILMGAEGSPQVRVDVDEKDAWRVRPDARAYGSVRGNAARRFPLRFVRIEPYVVPKRNLTGETTERTDTRVLQVIYALEADAPVYVGQQMDVYIEAKE